MATPHKCPVCDGAGLVSRAPHVAGDVPSWTDSATGPYACRPCLGTGILWDHAAPSAPPHPWAPAWGGGWRTGPVLITRLVAGFGPTEVQ